MFLQRLAEFLRNSGESSKHLSVLCINSLNASLTTTGRSMDTKQQKRLLSSTSALLTACFSVSSSSRYLSLTSCMALSSWGCRSPRPEHKHVHIPRCIQFQLETASRPSQPLANQLENSHFSLVTSCQLVSRPVNGCKSYRTKSLLV